MEHLLEPLFEREQQQNGELVERVARLLTDVGNSLTQEPSGSLIQLETAVEPPCHQCYICGDSEDSQVKSLACGHALCSECIQSQVEHLPKPGQQFLTRNAKCGICSSWIAYENAPKEFSAIKEREDALLERLKADNDPEPELQELLSSGSLLSKWQFMICVDCKETCYAGKHECVAADEEAEAQEPWKCINCLDCDQDFPTTCEAHGDKHVAFKCFFCCNIATFFCGGKTHFCEQCHKHGWNAVPMKVGECRPGCDGRHPDHGTKKIHCLGCVICRSLGLNLSTKSAQSKQRLAVIKVKKGLPVTAEEAALAAEQLELERLEAERLAAEKRAADLRKLMDLQMSQSDAEALLDVHNGNVDQALEERRQALRREEEQRARDAARDAAVESLRAMGFNSSLEELQQILSLKNNNIEQAIEVLLEHAGILELLVQLGWNEADAQSALEQSAWDRDRAEIQLKEEKHRKQCRYPGQVGFYRRIEKILRKQHSACLAEVGAPCICKTVEAKSSPAAPVASLVAVESCALDAQAAIEEFSGAFALPRRHKFTSKKSFPSAQLNVPSEREDAAANAQGELEKNGDEGFIVVRGRRRFSPQLENAEAEESASNESSLNANGSSCVHDEEADAPSECSNSKAGSDGSNQADRLADELSREFPRSRAARRGRAYAKLRQQQQRIEPENCMKAEENAADSDCVPCGMQPPDEEEQGMCCAGCNENAEAFAEEFSGAFAKLNRS